VQRHRHWTLRECSVCGVQAWHPMKNPGPEWYESHHGYPWMQWLPPAKPRWQHREYLKDRPAPGGRLLDVGCGTGAFLAAARDAGYQVTGVDFAEGSIRAARSRFGLDSLHTATLEDFARQEHPGSFDVVTFFEVLEHQDNLTAFMDSVKRLLKPRGFVALSVPNRDRWPPATNDPWDLPPHHFTRWNAPALRRACGCWGLAELSLRTSSASLPHLAEWIREVSHVNDVGLFLLGWLERRKSGGSRPELAVHAGQTVMMAAQLTNTLLLPVTLPLKAILRTMARSGRSLYLVARLTE
jgi:SAM-dependent methyltransferase